MYIHGQKVSCLADVSGKARNEKTRLFLGFISS